MKPIFRRNLRCLLLLGVLLTLAESLATEWAVSSNHAPTVEVTFPQRLSSFVPGMDVRLRAKAQDADGKVQSVEFYVGTNLVGVAMNPPFSAVWSIPSTIRTLETMLVRAIAVDDLGARTTSKDVPIRIDPELQLVSVVRINSPRDDQLFAAPATFEFGLEVVAGCLTCPGDRPAEFLVGTNIFTASPQKPFSITVTNLGEGEYRLEARYYRLFTESPAPIHVRAARVGIGPVSRTLDGQFGFGGFSTVPETRTMIESSLDLMSWSAIATNSANSGSFNFSEALGLSNRFYRLMTK